MNRFVRFVEHVAFVAALIITVSVLYHFTHLTGAAPMRTPLPSEQPICWIIEPAKESTPYMTLKPEVADKRRKAGDTVYAHYTQKPMEGA